MLLALAQRNREIDLVISLIVIGLVLIYKGYKGFRTRRKVEDTATSKIASAPQGLAEVQGYAWGTTPLLCLDGRPACYWSLVVQEERGSGKEKKWVTVFTYESKSLILVTDSSGACGVSPEKAQWEVAEETFQGSRLTEAHRHVLGQHLPDVLQYAQSGGLFGILGSKSRFIERRVLVGSPVYVRGNFSASGIFSETRAVGDYESFYAQMPKFNSATYRSTMFDSNKDGIIDEEEARNGFSMAANSFVRNAKSKSEMVKLTGMFIADAQHGLIIADVHEKHLVSRLKGDTALWLYGGFALFGTGLYFLLTYILRP